MVPATVLVGIVVQKPITAMKSSGMERNVRDLSDVTLRPNPGRRVLRVPRHWRDCSHDESFVTSRSPVAWTAQYCRAEAQIGLNRGVWKRLADTVSEGASFGEQHNK